VPRDDLRAFGQGLVDQRTKARFRVLYWWPGTERPSECATNLAAASRRSQREWSIRMNTELWLRRCWLTLIVMIAMGAGAEARAASVGRVKWYDPVKGIGMIERDGARANKS
jgi:hypothetical protein